jgi:trimethylamine:corrinoid methyltransferase-like protein
MATSGHSQKQKDDAQAQYTAAAATIAAVPAGQNTVIAYLNTQRQILQTTITKEGGAFLT